MVPGIEQRHARAGNVGDIAGHEHETTDLRRGRHQTVEDGHGTDRVHSTPLLGDLAIDWDRPLAEALAQLRQPAFQGRGLR